MIVSACLHVSVIDSPNPKHSPLSTSYDGTLDWNHSRWGGVWAICYLLLARFTTASPPDPPYQHHPPSNPRTHSPPSASIFTARTHYGNQTVCVYSESIKGKARYKSYDTGKSVCNFWLMHRSPWFSFPLDEKDWNTDPGGLWWNSKECVFWKRMLHQQWQAKVIFLTTYSRRWWAPPRNHQH